MGLLPEADTLMGLLVVSGSWGLQQMGQLEAQVQDQGLWQEPKVEVEQQQPEENPHQNSPSAVKRQCAQLAPSAKEKQPQEQHPLEQAPSEQQVGLQEQRCEQNQRLA